MKVLRLPVDASLSEISLQQAIDMLLGVSDGSTLLHLIVSRDQMFRVKQLLASIAERKPKALIGMLAREAMPHSNQCWDDCPERWMLVGRDYVVCGGPF